MKKKVLQTVSRNSSYDCTIMYKEMNLQTWVLHDFQLNQLCGGGLNNITVPAPFDISRLSAEHDSVGFQF